jgi:hypothetical protein
MSTGPPQLIRCLAFITGRLASAAREAEMRPSKVRQQRVRSLELLAAACVAEAARVADEGRPAPPPRLDPPIEPPAPEPSEELTEPGLRGVWTPPSG